MYSIVTVLEKPFDHVVFEKRQVSCNTEIDEADLVAGYIDK